MPWLFWLTIQGAKDRGALTLDLGRSDCDNPGLIAFKDHLAAERSTLTYWRYPADRRSTSSAGARAADAVRWAFRRLPRPIRRLAGTVLYPHVG